ncbi:unnamed protein product [marine sediment metagenome]|uniref:Uncharacterized protein n=1 Tax=marine sediment metagenome TaxID=412755 RepID=X1IKQ0_9ZZZZ
MKAAVEDGITVTGEMYGAHIETELLGAAVVSERLDGIRLDMSSEEGSEVTGPVHGIFMSNYNLGTISADNYYFIRCQENALGATVHYCLYFRNSQGDIDYFAQLHGTHDAWKAVGQPSGDNAGYIKVQLGSADRWLRLYDAGPA